MKHLLSPILIFVMNMEPLALCSRSLSRSTEQPFLIRSSAKKYNLPVTSFLDSIRLIISHCLSFLTCKLLSDTLHSINCLTFFPFFPQFERSSLLLELVYQLPST